MSGPMRGWKRHLDDVRCGCALASTTIASAPQPTEGFHEEIQCGNNRLRVAATAHIPAINAARQAGVTAVCSSRALDAQELSARWGTPIKPYANVNALLADKDIHCVSICGYPHQHMEHAIAAANAGKHLIIEKPLALSWNDCQAINAAVKATGSGLVSVLNVAFQASFWRSNPSSIKGFSGRCIMAKWTITTAMVRGMASFAGTHARTPAVVRC